jgi:archaellum component FlaC
MKSKKIVVDYNNVKEYTGNKIDLDIDKVNKCISNLEDFIFNYQDKLEGKKEELAEQKELLNKLNNLKRFN